MCCHVLGIMLQTPPSPSCCRHVAASSGMAAYQAQAHQLQLPSMPGIAASPILVIVSSFLSTLPPPAGHTAASAAAFDMSDVLLP